MSAPESPTAPRSSRVNSPRVPLNATPALQRALDKVGGALTRSILLHGLATIAICAALWIGWSWFADYVLRVPRAVRLGHLAIAAAVPVFIGWRFLWRPWSRRPSQSGLAMLIERANEHGAKTGDAKLGELFVSAVELQQTARPSGDPERIGEVLALAETRARSVDLRGVLDRRPALLRGAFALLLVAVGAYAASRSPDHTRIFVARFLGGDEPWPQRTHLLVSIPAGSERAKVDVGEKEIAVRIARGGDLPVLVEAEGSIPDEVSIQLSNGDEIALSGGGGGEREFRAVLRAVQEDFAFHVSGGDDPHGDRAVRVSVLEPPDLSGLAIRIVPPAYTGLAERLERDHDVRVPAGSSVSIAILPHPADAHGEVRLLPDDRTIALEPRPFPKTDAAPGAPGVTGETVQGLGFDLVADRSLRYRFRLTDSTGLENPDPGLFAIEVAEDRAPEVEMIVPGRAEVETVRTGSLRIVARASDDFGLRALAWRATRQGAGENEAVGAALASVAPATPESDGRTSSIGTSLLEARALVPAGVELSDGEQITLVVTAADDRPDTGTEQDAKRLGKSAPVRVRIVTDEEFLRRLQDRLSRLRVQVGELEELARSKKKRVSELVASLESDAPGSAAGSGELAAALSGVRRVQVDAETATRELASITEGVLYAKLDDKSAALFELLDASAARTTTREFRVDAWRSLAQALHEGRAGAASGLAPQLVGLVEAALTISHADCTAASAAAERATLTVDLADVHGALVECVEAQEAAQKHIEDLLSRLVEWDDFQSVVSLARDILTRQKSLNDRTRTSAQDK
ncbi:MAG: DUF4175 domain-containing protein [Planctomycetes bacterium]|nr:DUF4175 domain-containing protein [Planctomycetota bacterium]